MNSKNLVEKLNKIKLFNCENIKIGDVLYLNLNIWNSLNKIGLLHAFYYILYASIFSEMNFKINGDPKILSIFTMNTRKDHKKAFFDITNLLNNIIVFESSKPKLHINNLKNFYLPFIWIKEKCNKIFSCTISISKFNL